MYRRETSAPIGTNRNLRLTDAQLIPAQFAPVPK